MEHHDAIRITNNNNINNNITNLLLTTVPLHSTSSHASIFNPYYPPPPWPPKIIAAFLLSKCEINARDRAKGIADLSPWGRLDRPAVALTKSCARRSSSIAHTSQHARSPWIPSLSLFHAKRKEAMAMSCKSFVCRNIGLIRICGICISPHSASAGIDPATLRYDQKQKKGVGGRPAQGGGSVALPTFWTLNVSGMLAGYASPKISADA